MTRDHDRDAQDATPMNAPAARPCPNSNNIIAARTAPLTNFPKDLRAYPTMGLAIWATAPAT
jgi:hypothetical protein